MSKSLSILALSALLSFTACDNKEAKKDGDKVQVEAAKDAPAAAPAPAAPATMPAPAAHDAAPAKDAHAKDAAPAEKK